MKPNRNYVTPFISLVFLVTGFSGVLMFFHLWDGYTEVVHELAGVFFILWAVLHIILNWKALRIHFKKKVFIPASLAVFILSAGLIIAERMHPPIDMVMINKIVKAPISDAFKALDINYDKAAEKLKENGIHIDRADTIEAIWMNNNADPEKVIDLIME